jgi:hypothetical protein
VNNWDLRAEILAATHRWYLIVAFMLFGALMGWGASNIWPSEYQASLDLYVGLNVYRSPYDRLAASSAGRSFRLVDDYKNWQMEQLNALILTDPFLEEVLVQLQRQDSYWDGYAAQDLRHEMDVFWRNVGEWHLVVKQRSPEHAIQAVEAWSSVVLEKVGEAIEHANRVVVLDNRITVLEGQLLADQDRLNRLIFVKNNLKDIRDGLEGLPSDDVVSPADHWKIMALVSLVADWDPSWQILLDAAPEIGSNSADYGEWMGGIQSFIDEEIINLPGEISMIDQLLTNTTQEYEIETESSEGLASTLEIDRISNQSPDFEIVLPKGALSLVGAVLGFLCWGIWFLWCLRQSQR